MEWMAPKRNFYACILCALSDEYNSVPKALGYMGIELHDVDWKPKTKKPMKEIDKYKARELYEAGNTINEVAKILGTHNIRIAKLIQEAGGTVKSRGGYKGKKKLKNRRNENE